jgi:spermidine synthase
VQRWDFSAADLGGFSYGRLVLVSVLGLFLELLMIRWISSEIRIFAFFKNFVLIACFLGFGLGCYLCRRKMNLLVMAAPLLALALLIKLPWRPLREVVASLPAYLGGLSDVQIWGVQSASLTWVSLSQFLVGILFAVPVFALVALVFVPIGQLVGWHLENARRGIAAYSLNVVGSLAGILLYTLICFLSEPPPIWFALAGAMTLLMFWPKRALGWLSIAAFAACVVLTTHEHGAGAVYWSPYQKLKVTPVRENGETVRYNLTTNDSWYQQILNLSNSFVASHAHLFNQEIEWNPYNLPYHFYPHPTSVLILGSGMGNDVAAALRNGAREVVAVEIDPLILKLGRELHFERPYDSPAVRTIVDDARSYVQNSRDRFHLIVFSLLDSHTTSSHYSNIRTDNYVYTLEALTVAKRLLEPDGIFIIKFQVAAPWIAGRLHGLLEQVFDRAPLQVRARGMHTTRDTFFITGSQVQIKRALQNPALLSFVSNKTIVQMQRASPTTDDWPYFYQREPGVPAAVLIMSAVLVLLCGAVLNRIGPGVRAIRWHFFFLGAGFLLIEAQIISKMALLFGTTWVVNAIVIAGLLLLIVCANVLVEKWPGLPIRLAYVGIFVSTLVSYIVPLESFFYPSAWMKGLAASLVLCLPVFFASIVFIRSFADFAFEGDALGSNLMGALVGGLLESLSFSTGIRSLLVLAAVLYLASYLSLRQRQAAPAGVATAQAG